MSRTSVRAIAIALVCAFLCIAISEWLSSARILEFHSVVLTLIGAAYYGFAFRESESVKIIIEVVVATIFVFMALLGIWYNSTLLIVGLFLHGIWDLMHTNSKRLASIPHWYIPFCVIFDWTVGFYLLWKL